MMRFIALNRALDGRKGGHGDDDDNGAGGSKKSQPESSSDWTIQDGGSGDDMSKDNDSKSENGLASTI